MQFAQPLTSKAFSQAEVDEFARFSGDFNPVHIDPTYARRSIAGTTIVHGIAIVLWALEEACHQILIYNSFAALRVEFLRPARVGANLHLWVERDKKSSLIILSVRTDRDDRIANISVYLDFAPQALTKTTRQSIPRRERVGITQSGSSYGPEAPTCLTLQQIKSAKGSLDLKIDHTAGTCHWPGVLTRYGATFIATVIASTRLVGMHCPGLNSVYCDLLLESVLSTTARHDQMKYRVFDVDRRFKLVSISIATSCFVGTVKAFVRPEQINGPSLNDIRNRVPFQAMKSERALIIGGSRGIGATATRVLAAAGAEVCFSFHKGHQDAAKLHGELVDFGAKSMVVQVDVTEGDAIQTNLIAEYKPTILVYCATPYIFRSSLSNFSSHLWAEFRNYYVEGFERIIRQAYSLGCRRAWQPSSVVLDEPRADMREYARAKIEQEQVANLLMNELPGLQIECPRLKRTLTDQTNGIVSSQSEDSIDAFLRHFLIAGA